MTARSHHKTEAAGRHFSEGRRRLRNKRWMARVRVDNAGAKADLRRDLACGAQPHESVTRPFLIVMKKSVKTLLLSEFNLFKISLGRFSTQGHNGNAHSSTFQMLRALPTNASSNSSRVGGETFDNVQSADGSLSAKFERLL